MRLGNIVGWQQLITGNISLVTVDWRIVTLLCAQLLTSKPRKENSPEYSC